MTPGISSVRTVGLRRGKGRTGQAGRLSQAGYVKTGALDRRLRRRWRWLPQRFILVSFRVYMYATRTGEGHSGSVFHPNHVVARLCLRQQRGRWMDGSQTPSLTPRTLLGPYLKHDTHVS